MSKKNEKTAPQEVVKRSKKETKTISKELKEKLLAQLKSGKGNVVNFRNIHKYLSNTDFSAYFKRMAVKYNLVEGTDYTKKTGEGKKIDYHITIDAAIKIINGFKLSKNN